MSDSEMYQPDATEAAVLEIVQRRGTANYAQISRDLTKNYPDVPHRLRLWRLVRSGYLEQTTVKTNDNSLYREYRITLDTAKTEYLAKAFKTIIDLQEQIEELKRQSSQWDKAAQKVLDGEKIEGNE